MRGHSRLPRWLALGLAGWALAMHASAAEPKNPTHKTAKTAQVSAKRPNRC